MYLLLDVQNDSIWELETMDAMYIFDLQLNVNVF